MKTINDLYKYCIDNEVKLLSSYDADWWKEYRDNSASFDLIFRRLYYSFYYFLQSREETIAEIVTNWTADVAALLKAHDKDFSELYRIVELSPTAYRLTDNYDMTETMDRDTGETIGSRSDSGSMTTGAQTNTTTGKVSPYDSETFYNDNQASISTGERQDSSSNTYGSQSNSGTEDYTLTRKGNIGVMTVQDMLKKQNDFWSSFNFYHYVFGVIAKELLTVGAGEDSYYEDYTR